MKFFLTGFLVAIFIPFTGKTQLLSITPDFPKDNDNITIILDASKGNQGLYNYGDPNNIYVHVGVTTNLSNNGGQQWLYVNGTTGGTYGGTTPALKATSLGNNRYQYTINNIRSFFGVPAVETIKSIAIIFRDANVNIPLVKKAVNIDGSDMYIPVYDLTVATKFTIPFFQPTFNRIPEPLFKQVGDNISLTAIANKPSTMKLFLNGAEIQSAAGVTTISASPSLTTLGTQTIRVDAIDGAVTRSETFPVFVTGILPLPAGVRAGINYEAGNTAATLVLFAPGKSRVSVIGEFPGNNWVEQSNYIMSNTPDGNYWWLRITGLTPGTEYAYQYLVDGQLKIADPYTEKVLDPYNNNDGNISATTYPGLRSYPAGQTGIVSLLQTNAPAYNWQVNNFQRPDKRNLVTYELLVRDFVAAHDWKTVRDSLNYLKNLGINAIELMPFNEFEGNDSWGYNPDYYFAPDKYYGPKNTLKEFIDSCHKKGIAVIMDIALNHSFGLSPMVQLYWDAVNNRPAINNPWFNPVAKHAFNVGYDMNHESLSTRYFVSRVVEHWLSEYKIDGFRFDLSKGFTQTQTCDANGNNCNVGTWGNVDPTRIAIWKKYYDTLQLKSPGCYAVLEHFADDAEEIELSNYGMMFWGNSNYNYNEASMGYNTGNSNFERAIHTARGWAQPYLMSYMESHDEERLMYKNVNFGNSSGTYNTRDLDVALKRMEMNASFFLTIPGPKMIWQFGELGYDYSITSCHPGNTIPQPYPSDQCRLVGKPIRWDYLQSVPRRRLYDIYSSLNKLRFHPWYKDVFTANAISIDRDLSGVFKSMRLRSATDSSCLVAIGNFDVVAQSGSVTFPVAGTWYDYLNGSTITATGSAQNFNLLPGEFHIYLNRNLINAVVTGVGNITGSGNQLTASVNPNPVSSSSSLEINVPVTGKVLVELVFLSGQKGITVFTGTMTRGKHSIPLGDKINNLPAGIHLLKIQSSNKEISIKLVIQ
ncbi:MAG: 1,4-alpha-glucan-branching protein [Chitinophagaceae bacterium]|nr:1,4-alpha-glucan-branching protein [Chitinophagaceae bacterium]